MTEREELRLLAWLDRAERFAVRLHYLLPPRLTGGLPWNLRQAWRLGRRLARWARRSER